VAVEVAKDAGVAAVERLGRLARDRAAVRARLLDHIVHFVARRDVVYECDAAPPGAVVRDSRIVRQLLPRPEPTAS
jgi:hypothetical protein